MSTPNIDSLIKIESGNIKQIKEFVVHLTTSEGTNRIKPYDVICTNVLNDNTETYIPDRFTEADTKGYWVTFNGLKVDGKVNIYVDPNWKERKFNDS